MVAISLFPPIQSTIFPAENGIFILKKRKPGPKPRFAVGRNIPALLEAAGEERPDQAVRLNRVGRKNPAGALP
jgi:hypothetical protein